MKSKNVKITNITNIFIYIILMVITIIFTNPLIAIVGVILQVIVNVILTRIEMKNKFKLLSEFIEKKEYNSAIEYIKSKIEDVYMLRVYNSCIITLIQLYMFTDKISDVVDLLNNHRYLHRNKELYYVIFLLAIVINDDDLIAKSINKIQKIKNKAFDVQKDIAVRIHKMLINNVMDEVVYNNTHYPLIKRICERCNDSSVILVNEDIKLTFNNKKNNLSKKQVLINNLLNILTFLSIPIGLLIININASKYDYFTILEHGYYFTSRLNILYLFILIPIINIIYSIYLRRNGYKYIFNLVLGVIFTILICIFGSFPYLYKDQFILDDTYFSHIEEKLELNMSDEFYVIYEDYKFDIEEDDYNEGLTVLKNGVVRFQSEVSVDKLKWIDSLSNKEIASPVFLINVKDYDYFLIYDLTSDSLNPNAVVSGHKYIVMALDKENPNIIFNEYIYK